MSSRRLTRHALAAVDGAHPPEVIEREVDQAHGELHPAVHGTARMLQALQASVQACDRGRIARVGVLGQQCHRSELALELLERAPLRQSFDQPKVIRETCMHALPPVPQGRRQTRTGAAPDRFLAQWQGVEVSPC